MYMGIPLQISAEGAVLPLMPVVYALLNLLTVVCIHDGIAGGFEEKIKPFTITTELDA